jgi:hypothetical protein
MGKFNNGAFVFTRARGLTPRDPSGLKALAEHYGIDPQLVPDYAGDRTAITRAIQRTAVGLSRHGILLRPIRRNNSEVVFGIVNEKANEAEERLDHQFAATVGWSAEPHPETVRGDHPVADRVRATYDELRGMVVADDWAPSITAALVQLGAAAVRDDGRVYWLPPQQLDAVRKLGAFLHEVGIDLVMCEIEAEARAVVTEVAQSSLVDELDRLQAEAAAFDGTQRPSTYEGRLDEYQRLQQRAVLYRDALGIGVEQAEAVLNSLRSKVEQMLDIRLRTRVHRDGTVSEGLCRRPEPSKVEAPAAEPTPAKPALVFAGARFELASVQPERYRAATATGFDGTLLSLLCRPAKLGAAGTVRAERVGEVVELVVEGARADDVAVGLRVLGIEVA